MDGIGVTIRAFFKKKLGRMQIQVTTRQRAAYYAPSMSYAVISIITPGDDEATLAASPLCVGVLRLEFYDIRQPHPDWRHFKAEDARHVWGFVLAHLGNTDTLLIHCDAGQSRSPGVAAALDKVLNGDDSRWWKGFRFNQLVYETLLEEAPTM